MEEPMAISVEIEMSPLVVEIPVVQQSSAPTEDVEMQPLMTVVPLVVTHTVVLPPPSEAILTGKDTVFALIIGINDYIKSDELKPLDGAVNDAKEFRKYLEEVLHVPVDNILSIENRDATRSKIMSGFRTHFIENSRIPDGGETTMIFYFAGHGSRAATTRNMIARDMKVETICPVDERTQDAAGQHIHSIPDYVLGWLLQELSQKKGSNITVILDSCHSGGIARRGEGKSRAAETDSTKIPAELDSHLWKGQSLKKPYRMWEPSATSHVLLAACQADETARELGDTYGEKRPGGRFTKHLLENLRWAPLGHITYQELIDRVPMWSDQKPHCGGDRIQRVVFNGNYPKAGRRSVPLVLYDPKATSPTSLEPKRTQPGGVEHNPDAGADEISSLFKVDMGTVAGVVTETEFTAYDLHGTLLCVMVAHTVLAQHSILRQKDRPFIDIPALSRAEVSDWKNDSMILHVYTPSDFPHTDALFSPTRTVTPRFVQASSLTDAQIALSVDRKSGEVVVEPRTPTMRKALDKVSFPMTPNPSHLLDAIDGVAHFNYFLDRVNAEDPVKGVTLEMHRLKGDFPHREPDDRGNLVQGDVARFASDDNAIYGFKICSKFPEDLYAYLFYFDPETFTIQEWYSPEGRNSAPLKTNGFVTVGMGGERAFEFTMEDGQVTSSGFIKLFVTREYVDLRWIKQTTEPFKADFKGTGRLKARTETFNKLATWDALTVVLTMTAGATTT
ncbi:Metacaspase-7 [Favolaschia claudopus]|uniref:Metacaspase-7 n=1 Tax=Favolaschia claudopus TaxID=2862362 RepID=A0AAW0BG60_9AGAR